MSASDEEFRGASAILTNVTQRGGAPAWYFVYNARQKSRCMASISASSMTGSVEKGQAANLLI